MCHIAPYIQLGFNIPVFGDRIGFGFWINFVVSTGYFFVDKYVALGVAAWYWPAMILGNALWMAQRQEPYIGMSEFWFMGLVNALSWTAQFIGHAFFEKRAPAIKTNLTYSLLAPFFITFEVMNVTFGFREGERMVKLR